MALVTLPVLSYLNDLNFYIFFFSCTLDYWGGLCLLHPEKYSRSEEAHSHNRGF